MTTVTANGVLQVWSDTNGDGEDDLATFTATTLTIIAADDAAMFSYTPGDGPTVVIEQTAYSVALGPDRLADWGALETEIFHVNAIDGFSADLMMIELGNGVDAFFTMRGDAFPVFASTGDFQTFVASATFGGVAPDVAPGVDIAFSSFPDADVTENDRIAGTDLDDVLSGGRGRDIISGNRGDDTLRGGDLNDRLYGGHDDDFLDGGRGNDIMIGGYGQDRFAFRQGYGNDRIFRFQDDADSILLSSSLWDGDLTAQDVVDTFGSVRNGAIILDFGDDSLTIRGLSDIALLADDLILL